jgi:hypothetical protein
MYSAVKLSIVLKEIKQKSCPNWVRTLNAKLLRPVSLCHYGRIIRETYFINNANNNNNNNNNQV